MIPELDKVFCYESKTAILDTPASQVKQGSEANEIKVAKYSMQGLGDYDRTDGYKQGDINLTWETMQLTQDRGRKFCVDTMDNLETANVSFGMLAGEFLRTKVAPEFDAFRMASYASKAGTKVSADITTGEDALAAIDTAVDVLNDSEVPEEGRVLFVSHGFYKLLKNAPTIERKIGIGNDKTFDRNFEILDDMRIVKMPTSRFYTAITQYDGETAGQEAGGYIKNASTGKDSNFMIIHPSSVLQVTKHTVTKVITPENNQTSDGYMYFFRAYHDALVYENRVNGIYSHYKTT
jgi:hypothetical protein